MTNKTFHDTDDVVLGSPGTQQWAGSRAQMFGQAAQLWPVTDEAPGIAIFACRYERRLSAARSKRRRPAILRI